MGVPFVSRLRGLLARLRRRLRDRWRGETAETYFDIHNLKELNPVLRRHDCPPLEPGAAQAEEGVAGAARFVLALLARSPRLRRRFPRALSEGPGGAFFRWVIDRLGLSERARKHVAEAFAANLSRRVRRVYELRSDLREAFPFGLTPRQRGEYLGWLLRHGRADFGLRGEEVLWFLFETDEDPSRGLAATFLLTPDWQERFPHGLTCFGWPALTDWLRREHELAGRWPLRARPVHDYRPWEELLLLFQARPDLEASFPRDAVARKDPGAVRDWLARQRDLPVPDAAWFERLRDDLEQGLPARRGVNVLGHFRYASGLQEAVFATVEGLRRCGVRVRRRDLPVNFPCDWRDTERYQDVELFDTTIVNAAANTFLDVFVPLAGLRLRAGVYRIAIWYWELSQVPPEWVGRARLVDEVWAPTRFIAAAMRAALDRPVVPMLPGVELPAVTPRPKSYFGLDDDKFLFLFMFDMGSVMARKNPLGLIDAFRRAFRRDEPAQLAIKVSRAEFHADSRRQLLEAAAAAGVTVIDRVLVREDVLSLAHAADCYVSLHRSEGLGLTMAESMLLGKPVIATGYSGNLDFMTPANSLLVDYREVPITDDIPPYPKGCVWADPSLDHAAELMRRVYERPREAAAMAERARREVGELLSLDAAGRRMLRRLEEIDALRAGRARAA